MNTIELLGRKLKEIMRQVVVVELLLSRVWLLEVDFGFPV
jgi:hypothetical protein